MTKLPPRSPFAIFAFLLSALVALIFTIPAAAQDRDVTIQINRGDVALDLTQAMRLVANGESSIQIQASADTDGIVRRIEVEAIDGEPSGNWAVFSLANPTERQIDRLIVVPHYRFADSGIWRPELDARRIVNITPTEGFALEQQADPNADVFQLTLNPNAVVTFVMELAAPNLPQVYLWEPEAYKDTVNSYTLYQGIVLGIGGLLALFLTILFVVRGTTMFPAAAALALAVLAYTAIDFGFLGRLMVFTPAEERIARAASEIALSGTLVIFLFAYLHLARWNRAYVYGAGLWVLAMAGLAVLAVFEPSLASGIARISLAVSAVAGAAIIIWQAFKGYDRAIMLVPSWIAILVWLFAAGAVARGSIDNDIVQPALAGGLILIVLLIGFTVMQHAFAGGVLRQGLFSDVERQALAMSGSGDIVFDWDVLRDQIVTRPDISGVLGLPTNSLRGPARDWLSAIHLDDRDMFRSTLDAIVEQGRGRIRESYRLRGADGHYHWYEIKARPIIGADGEVVRCIGTMSEVTEQKKAQERLLHDSVHDNMTGLPNRELFIDRLSSLFSIAQQDDRIRPLVILIDIDRFKQVNDELGLSTGDTILLTIARRLTRLCAAEDSVSRFSGDLFAIAVASKKTPEEIAALASNIQKAIAKPIDFAKREIVLRASIGLANWTPRHASANDLVKDAELALHQAKRFGGDRIEPFRPAFRSLGSDRLHLEADLHRAFERGELSVAYQPIVRLTDMGTAGFEALIRWDHPQKGRIAPADFVPIAENSGLIVRLGLFVLQRAADDLADLTKKHPDRSLFVAVNLSSSQFIRQDLVSDVRSIIKRTSVDPQYLRLELTESMVMQNPQQSIAILDRLRDLGVGLSLDDFGTGYSSLSYLTRFPFDGLKIDRSFVVERSQRKRKLLHSLVRLGQDLDLKVVAEGVEDDETLELLREAGCDYVQSYMMGAPMEIGRVRSHLADQIVTA